MRKWKKLVNILLVFVIGVFLVFPAYADDIYDAKQKQKELEQQLADSENLLTELKDKVSQAQAAVDEIDGQIAEVEGVINEYEVQKGDLELQIAELQRQIEEKQVQIEYEYGLMSKRIKFLYENLGNSYVEAFLTSDTFADALNKVQYLIELSDYDREQMQALQKLQDGIRNDQNAIQVEKDEVDILIGAQNEQKAVLDDMLAVKAEALGVAQSEEANAEEQNAYIAALLEEQKETVNTLVAEYEAQLAAQRAAELAAQEAARQAAQEAGDDGGGGEDNGGGGGGTVSPGSTIWTSGDFLWPLPAPYDSSYITSWFGYRADPFGGGYTSYHSGIDIGAPCNTPILAVLPGTVVISQDGWNGGCGNYTVIYHGGNLYTEYMHQNVRAVSVGQNVSQGEVIGYVGTTGSSTGYHLHIGVVVSDHGFDYTSRVDPSPYLGL